MSSDSEPAGAGSLTTVLTAIQQGVTTINAMTQAIKLIFPSSS